MRSSWTVLMVLVVGATAAGPAQAGVYNRSEPWPIPRPLPVFQNELAAYRAAASTAATAERVPGTHLPPLATHYLNRIKDLEALEAHGGLTPAHRSDLGAYYLRLGKHQAAVRVLEPGARDGDFLLLANLATAYELSGEGEVAKRTREQALAAWPRSFPGWDTFQVNFYRKAELYHQKLLTLRLNRPRQGAGQLQFDNLFPGLLARGGRYEVGGISPARWSEIPMDASQLVMQLLLWLPFDDGLHWLLGELLNASGDVAGAAAMMKAVVEKQPDAMQWNVKIPEELEQHYQAVSARVAADIERDGERLKFSLAAQKLNDPNLNAKVVAALGPRSILGVPGAGAIADEYSRWAVAFPPQPPPAPTEASPAGSGSPSRLIDWTALGIGFALGAVVVWLLGQQIRQARKARV